MAYPRSTWFVARLSVLPSLAILALFTLPLLADSNESESMESSSYPVPQSDNPSGFRLNEPNVFVGGHLGMNMPRAGSDLFDMITRELTLEKNDFRAPVFGFDFGVLFRSHWAAVFGLEYTRASKGSESRNYVDESGQPIYQNTRFQQYPLTGTLRFYPRKFGETIGSYAWIPTRILPYVGGGGGFVHYKFMQQGSFVDNKTLDIFEAFLESGRFALTKHVVSGVDISLTPLVFVNMEARYSWAKADLTGGFKGFQPIDLSGLRLSGGICFRF